MNKIAYPSMHEKCKFKKCFTQRLLIYTDSYLRILSVIIFRRTKINYFHALVDKVDNSRKGRVKKNSKYTYYCPDPDVSDPARIPNNSKNN